MNQSFVRRRTVTLAAMGAAVVLTACGDKRVKELTLGITRDSAMSILAQNLKGGGHSAYPNVYTSEEYLTGGKNYQILYYTPDNDKIGMAPAPKLPPGDTAKEDTVPWKKLTPLVFVENKLAAKGWSSWDSMSTALHIPPKHHGP